MMTVLFRKLLIARMPVRPGPRLALSLDLCKCRIWTPNRVANAQRELRRRGEQWWRAQRFRCESS